MKNLKCEHKLWTHPFTNSLMTGQHTNPAAILLTVFISTSAVALITQANKNDVYQPHIIIFCALFATVASAVKSVALNDFIFGYLLWGCIAGATGSWIAHRVLPWNENGRMGGQMAEKNIEREKLTPWA